MRHGPATADIEYRRSWRTHVVALWLIFWSLMMLWLCWRSGAEGDYLIYLRQWQSLLEGGNPWHGTGNAYGPLHTTIGLVLPLGLLAPKFVMVGALLAANTLLVLELLHERSRSPIQIIYLIAIPTNVLVVGAGVIYGQNDALVAALLVAAVLLRHRRRFLASGILVGFAALTKYYPLLLLPFFALDEGRLRWSVIVGGIVIVCLGFAGALAMWGDGPIQSMIFGANRGPKLLSVIMALTSVFGDEGIVGWLIRYNSYLVVSGVIVALLFTWKARLNWLEGVVVGYLVMLTLYKVGHQQFYLPWLFMVASLPLVDKQSADSLAIIFLPVVLLLSLYQFGYQFGSDGYWEQLLWVRQYGGFIAFPVSVASIAVYVVHLDTHHPAVPINLTTN